MIYRTQKTCRLKPTALRTVPSPKLIGTGRLVLVKTKPAVFYCQMRQAELENPVFCSDEFPVRSHEFPVPVKNRESCAMHWDCSANRLGSGRNALKWSEVSKIAC